MRNTLQQFKAAQELNSGVNEGQVLDTVFDFISAAGWSWTEPQIVVDPNGDPHYIPADAGFKAQVFQVYDLHKQMVSLGWLAQ